MNNDRSLNSLLSQIKQIAKHHDEISRLSGEQFNLFQIINLTSNEVRVHSSLLAELLNSKGLHGQGGIFLDLFIKAFGLPDIDIDSCSVTVEKHIGRISEDKTSGGRIDILIQDKKGNCIAVENKIYAGDQDKQLIRYHNYCKEQGWSSCALIYLTLWGGNAADYSCGELVADKDYKLMSYQKDIINWLEACRKECVLIPVVREGITHYINLIKHLTNQTGSKKMKEEIYDAITNSPDSFRAADTIGHNVKQAKHTIQWKFWKTLRKKIEENGFKVIDDDKTASSDKTYAYHCNGKNNHPGLWVKIFDKDGITIHWGAEIETNFYIGFTVEHNGIGSISDQNEYARYRAMVQEVDPGYFIDSKHWLGWKHSDPVLNFWEFNTDEVYRLGNEKYMDEIVSRIADDAIKDINSLTKLLPVTQQL